MGNYSSVHVATTAYTFEFHQLIVCAMQIMLCILFLQVGPTYGRKTIAGLLASSGIRIAETRVGDALREINPQYHVERCNRAKLHLNPTPYHATHFGQKIHIDQNEKIVMFGVTHVCAIDGFSGMVVGFISMPIKNNVEIYANLFRYIAAQIIHN